MDLPLQWDRTLLHIAAYCDRTRIVHALIDAGADVNDKDIYGYTPITMACFRGCKGSAETLASRGADPTIQDGHVSAESCLFITPQNAMFFPQGKVCSYTCD